MTANLLALLERDPAAGILAAADLRERRAKAATPAPWHTQEMGHDEDENGCDVLGGGVRGSMEEHQIAWLTGTLNVRCDADAEHIAAEANPEFALAGVRRWRGVVERHGSDHMFGDPFCPVCRVPRNDCPDLGETAGEVRAYLGGTA